MAVDVTAAASRGMDGSLGMDFLRHGVGSSPVGTGAATAAADAAIIGAVTTELFRPEVDSWNVDVERTECPAVSPDKTKGADATAGTARLLIGAGAGALDAVESVTLDVCIVGEGSTSMENLRGCCC